MRPAETPVRPAGPAKGPAVTARVVARVAVAVALLPHAPVAGLERRAGVLVPGDRRPPRRLQPASRGQVPAQSRIVFRPGALTLR